MGVTADLSDPQCPSAHRNMTRDETQAHTSRDRLAFSNISVI